MIIIASYSNVSVTYTADGTQIVFSFPFDYLRKAFVKVESDGNALEQGTDFSVYEKTVVFTEAPAEGTTLRIFRETDTTPLVSWADASVLRAKDMTIQQIQVLHILEEYKGQYNDDLANMLIIAGVVTDSGELQHIVDQLNLIDSNTALVIGAVGEVNQAKEDAQASATSASNNALNAANSASSASDSATQAENLYEALIAQGGHPFQAATIADMTDTTKIYVYTGSETDYTNGNWYYYNGSAWVSGGVYNAVAFNTDTTLTISGAAADAKVTGDNIRELRVRSVNLFDATNPDIKNLIPGANTTNYNNSAKSVVVPVTITDQTNITITKTVASSRFSIGTYSSYPAIGTAPLSFKYNHSATSLTITVDSTVKYILIYLYLEGTDTDALQSILDGLMVQFGTQYIGYEPYYNPRIAPSQVSAILGSIPDNLNNLQRTEQYDFAPIIVGRGEIYIEYDSEAETLTIPRDVVYVGHDIDGTKDYKAINLNDTIILTNVNYETIGALAVKLVLDTSDWDFKLLPYFTANSSTQKLVANLRLKGSGYEGGLSTPYPWKIDGKPFGVDLSLYDITSNVSCNQNIEMIGHRGWNIYGATNVGYPENTLVAFKAARENGCFAVETDVQFTSDGVAVLLHDDTINRTARNMDGTEIAGTVYISQITYAEALEYDFGIKKGSKYAGTKIPTLAEFVKLCRNIGLKAQVELKADANLTEAKIHTIMDIVNNNGLRGNVCYASAVSSYLTTVKNYDADVELCYSVQGINATTITTANSLKTSTNRVIIASNSVTDAECELCANARIPLYAWDIETGNGIRNANPYITGFTVSSPILANKLLFDYGLNN